MDYFIEGYSQGITPNPCIECNRLLRWDYLYRKARSLGATHLATGHYARVIKDNQGNYHLLKGCDAFKDQSYFLARLTQKQLSTAIFPLGNMTKKDVKILAAEKGFFPVTQHESQDVCFIKGGTYAEFLARESGFKSEPGLIQDSEGNTLGRHNGLHRFTIGQRRGINCPASEPYYVLRIDKKRNRLIVGFKKDINLSTCRVNNLNWINPIPPLPLPVDTRVRYRHQAAPSIIARRSGNAVIVKFDRPQSAITPGQGAVFYRGEEVLGTGWIA